MQTKSKVLLAISVTVLLISVFPVYVDASVEEKTRDIGYDSLSEELQDAYTSFKNGIDKRDPRILISHTGISPLDCQIMIYAFMSDHPENFWASYYDSYLKATGPVKRVWPTEVVLETINIDHMSVDNPFSKTCSSEQS